MAYSPIGSNNATGDGSLPTNKAVDRELFQTKFSTDVLRYFMDTNVAKALITTKSIDSGKAENFPIVGNATAQSVANDASELAVQNISATERTIVIDDMVVSHAYLTDLDKAMAHYDSQSAQAESIGRAMSKKVDIDVIAKVIEAGDVTDATSAGTAGLKAFTDDVFTSNVEDDLTSGSGVYSAAVKAVAEYDDKDAVGEPVFLFRTNQYYSLLNNPAQTGLTWVNDPFAQSGKVPMLLGKKVLKSPHFPALAGASIAAGEVGGILFAKEAVGMLELIGIQSRVDYVPNRLAHLITSKMAVGYGILNHACAINIKQETP
ncbi:MAG: putative minor capsid protein 10B [Prokaryotic dsDNA virus sp.]|jgi:hypothetical protein|nr:hypothetical protein [Flavobacteriaceae bacterium]QDP68309.1 MAG: putative minor capsid protein 10B [Prokaryotic dsDNA virus sp.]|tara:strand:- start:22977 stop:23933 length:957 start_codon:yes stop_codon:yes gene_type:complete